MVAHDVSDEVCGFGHSSWKAYNTKKKKKLNTRKPMKMTKMFCSGPGKK